jgi:hypothetical protein
VQRGQRRTCLFRFGGFGRIDCADIEHAGRNRMIWQAEFRKVIPGHRWIFIDDILVANGTLQRRLHAFR